MAGRVAAHRGFLTWCGSVRRRFDCLPDDIVARAGLVEQQRVYRLQLHAGGNRAAGIVPASASRQVSFAIHPRRCSCRSDKRPRRDSLGIGDYDTLRYDHASPAVIRTHRRTGRHRYPGGGTGSADVGVHIQRVEQSYVHERLRAVAFGFIASCLLGCPVVGGGGQSGRG